MCLIFSLEGCIFENNGEDTQSDFFKFVVILNNGISSPHRFSVQNMIDMFRKTFYG